MKKIAVMFGLFLLVAAIVFPVVGSGNYRPSNCSVEQNVGAFIADRQSPSTVSPSYHCRRQSAPTVSPYHRC